MSLLLSVLSDCFVSGPPGAAGSAALVSTVRGLAGRTFSCEKGVNEVVGVDKSDLMQAIE